MTSNIDYDLPDLSQGAAQWMNHAPTLYDTSMVNRNNFTLGQQSLALGEGFGDGLFGDCVDPDRQLEADLLDVFGEQPEAESANPYGSAEAWGFGGGNSQSGVGADRNSKMRAAAHGVTVQSLAQASTDVRPMNSLMSMPKNIQGEVRQGISAVMRAAPSTQPPLDAESAAEMVQITKGVVPFDVLTGMLRDTLHGIVDGGSDSVPQKHVMMQAALSNKACRVLLRRVGALPKAIPLQPGQKRPHWVWETDEGSFTFETGRALDRLHEQLALWRARLERFGRATVERCKRKKIENYHTELADKLGMVRSKSLLGKGRKVLRPMLKLDTVHREGRLDSKLIPHVLPVTVALCAMLKRHRQTENKRGRSNRELNCFTTAVTIEEIANAMCVQHNVLLCPEGVKELQTVLETHVRSGELLKQRNGYVPDPERLMKGAKLGGRARDVEDRNAQLRREVFLTARDTWANENLDQLDAKEREEIWPIVQEQLPDRFEGVLDTTSDLVPFLLNLARERFEEEGHEQEDVVWAMDMIINRAWKRGNIIRSPYDDKDALWGIFIKARDVARQCNSELRQLVRNWNPFSYSSAEVLRDAIVMMRVVTLLELYHTRAALHTEMCKARMRARYEAQHGTAEDAASNRSAPKEPTAPAAPTV